MRRESAPVGDHVVGTAVLRDLQNTPRGLLVVATPDQRASLDLAIGRIPVRAFFLLVAGSLVVLAAFLSFVVSGRISRPIERLEKGALPFLPSLLSGAPLLKDTKRSLILIWMDGGMSHLDTFDGKPEASPDIRGELVPKETSLEGVFFSEHLN